MRTRNVLQQRQDWTSATTKSARRMDSNTWVCRSTNRFAVLTSVLRNAYRGLTSGLACLQLCELALHVVATDGQADDQDDDGHDRT